jgi:mannose-1-phosphate guanylyltransferase
MHDSAHLRGSRSGIGNGGSSSSFGSAVAPSRVWPLVLAGGEGQRLRPFVRRWLGEERPKQYCAFVGDRSMLRHTWDRAEALAGSCGHVVTVVGTGHSRFLDPREGAPGPVLEQPRDCGTAPGVFLPLTLAVARDPGATVVVLPADHFVHPQERFVAQVAQACEHAAGLPGRLVIVGARPRAVDPDYGWIVPGPQARGFRVRRVDGFEEKPAAERARQIAAAGGLLSTMVVAACADTLWRLGERVLPGMMRGFQALLRALRHPPEELPEAYVAEAIARAYRHMPRADLSRDLLQRCPGVAVVQPLDGIEWSDWGRPERIAESLRRVGAQPSWPPLTAIELPASSDDGPRLEAVRLA